VRYLHCKSVKFSFWFSIVDVLLVPKDKHYVCVNILDFPITSCNITLDVTSYDLYVLYNVTYNNYELKKSVLLCYFIMWSKESYISLYFNIL